MISGVCGEAALTGCVPQFGFPFLSFFLRFIYRSKHNQPWNTNEPANAHTHTESQAANTHETPAHTQSHKPKTDTHRHTLAYRVSVQECRCKRCILNHFKYDTVLTAYRYAINKTRSYPSNINNKLSPITESIINSVGEAPLVAEPELTSQALWLLHGLSL